jgi:hypothetical protein
LKCAFGVTSGRFLGFVVHEHGIQIGTISGKNPSKRLGKKSGKELPDWVKAWVRTPGKTKMYKTSRLLGFG